MVDLKNFAIQLAGLLRGEFKPEAESYDQKDRATVILPEEAIRITIYRRYDHKAGQVGLDIDATDVPPQTFYGDKYKLPHITITTTRPLEILVKDIKRRLIEPAAAPLAERRKSRDQDQLQKEGLKSAVESLRRRFPQLTIHYPDPHGRTDRDRAPIYCSKPNLSGYVFWNGSVNIERIESMSENRFAQFLAMMTADEKVKSPKSKQDAPL